MSPPLGILRDSTIGMVIYEYAETSRLPGDYENRLCHFGS
jgi:hypothetical protein